MQWVLERKRLQQVADALQRLTVCDDLPSHTFTVGDDGMYLEYAVRLRNSAATVRVAVSETEELFNLHLPGTVMFIRKEQLLDPNDARLGN